MWNSLIKVATFFTFIYHVYSVYFLHISVTGHHEETAQGKEKDVQQQVPEGAGGLKIQMERSQIKKGKHRYFTEEGDIGTTGII